jgi:hypothetical protein
MPDRPKRFLCRIPLPDGIIVCTCGRCRWTHHIAADDGGEGQAEFDIHRCEDFPLPPTLILPSTQSLAQAEELPDNPGPPARL